MMEDRMYAEVTLNEGYYAGLHGKVLAISSRGRLAVLWDDGTFDYMRPSDVTFTGVSRVAE